MRILAILVAFSIVIIVNSVESQIIRFNKDSLELIQNKYFSFPKLKKDKFAKRWQYQWSKRFSDSDHKINLTKLLPSFTKSSTDDNIKMQMNKYIWQDLGPKKIDSSINMQMTGNGRVNCIAFHPKDSLKMLIGSACGGVWKSDDYGKNWVVSEMKNLPILGISDIIYDSKNPNIVYASTGDFDGNSFFGGYSMGIIESTDSGDSWHLLNGFDYSEQLFISKMVLFENRIFYSSTKGIVQFNLSTKEKIILDSIGVYSDLIINQKNNEVFASKWNLVGNSQIIKTNTSFIKEKIIWQDSAAGRIRLHLSNFDSNKIYSLISRAIGGNSLDLIYSNDKGENWISMGIKGDLIEYQGFYNIVLCTSSNDSYGIYCGGVRLFKYNKIKSDFELIDKMLHYDMHDIKFNPFTNDLFVACDGGIYKSVDNGNNWENISSGLSISQIYKFDLNPINDSIYFIGTQDNGIIQYDYNKWKHILTGDGMLISVDDSIPDRVFGSIQKGVIGKFDRNLEQFSEVIRNPEPSNNVWLADYKFHPNNRNLLLVAYTNLYEIDILTNSTYQLTNFDDRIPIDYFLISKSNPYIIYLSKNKMFLKSEDYGKNWDTLFTSKSFISEFKIDENDNSIWLVCSGFNKDEKVFHLINKTIVNETFNLINIPVNTLEIINLDGKDYTLVGTDFGIFSKANGDSLWSIFGTNFPNAMVTQLKYSQNFGKLFASTFGRGLWSCDLSNCVIESPKIQGLSKYIFCEGELVTLKVLNSDNGSEYKWNDGTLGPELVVKESGSYYVGERIPVFCWKSSEKISITFNPISKAKVLLVGRNPICTGEQSAIKSFIVNSKVKNYKIVWSNGDTNKTIYPNEPGNYYFKVIYENECYAWSDTFFVRQYIDFASPIIEKVGERLLIQNADNAMIYQWYIDGKLVEEYNEISLPLSKLGDYYVIAVDSNYCKNISNIINISIGNPVFGDFNLSIYPNPSTDQFLIQGELNEKSDLKIKIFDESGRVIENIILIKEKGYFELLINSKLWAIGNYFLEISTSKLSKKFKLIKIK